MLRACQQAVTWQPTIRVKGGLRLDGNSRPGLSSAVGNPKTEEGHRRQRNAGNGTKASAAFVCRQHLGQQLQCRPEAFLAQDAQHHD
jgi:hypothetical protein